MTHRIMGQLQLAHTGCINCHVLTVSCVLKICTDCFVPRRTRVNFYRSNWSLCVFRYFNEMSAQGLRARTVSSPIPYTPSPSSSRPISPGRFLYGYIKKKKSSAINGTFDISSYNLLSEAFIFAQKGYQQKCLILTIKSRHLLIFTSQRLVTP